MFFLSRARRKNTGLLFFLLFLCLFDIVFAQELIIVEVQIEGETSSQDFIKIFNPNEKEIDISGYKLRKRTSTGNESSIRVFPAGSKVLPKGYFVWANSKDNFHLTVQANTWSSATLAKNNSIAILDPEGKIIDALAWGDSINPFVEGEAFPENPGKNQKLKRKIGPLGYQDTNNNKEDFYLTKIEKNSSQNEPEIFLSFKKENPINKEIEIKISALNLKEGVYDLKAGIEKEGEILSEIFNEKENKWQSSNYYLKNFFENSLPGTILKIRIKEDAWNLSGEAEVFAKIRKVGKNKYWEERNKIILLEPEVNNTSLPLEIGSIKNGEKNKTRRFFYIFSTALLFSFGIGVGITLLTNRFQKNN